MVSPYAIIYKLSHLLCYLSNVLFKVSSPQDYTKDPFSLAKGVTNRC